MRVAFLTTDNREQQKKYDLDMPFFGPAPAAILDGLKLLASELEIHVVSCAKKRMPAPQMLGDNVHFHQPIVPYLGWGRTAFLGCVLATRKVLKQIQPDIVHGQGTERDCAVSAVHSGFPNVLTIHGNMQRIHQMKLLGAGAYYRMASMLETHALRRTDGVFCNSNHTRSLVESRTDRTWLVPNPLRPAFLEEPAEEQVKVERPVILVVGVVTRLKRPAEILQAMGQLHAEGGEFEICFIGGHSPASAYGQKFQKLLDEASGDGYAKYLGVLDEGELVKAMDRADALIHFPEEEAFGLVVAEALIRKLKVFAAKVGGIPDILEGMEAAEQFADLADLKEGVAGWLAGGANKPGSNPATVRARYHPRAVAEKHLEIYQEVLQ